MKPGELIGVGVEVSQNLVAELPHLPTGDDADGGRRRSSRLSAVAMAGGMADLEGASVSSRSKADQARQCPGGSHQSES